MTEYLKPWYRRACFVLPIVAVILLLPGARVYHSYSSGTLCASCHEISQPYDNWYASTHRNVACSTCHGSVFSADIEFHLKNLHRVVAHVRGQVPDQIRLKPNDIQKMVARCQSCHQQEYAEWAAGPHAVTYQNIFLNESHNGRRHLADDCLRCHGMHFEGGIRDLVSTTDTQGPWKLQNAKLAEQPAIPCIACHQVHRSGDLVSERAKLTTKPEEHIYSPSLGLFDRRELDYVSVTRLSLPAMRDGDATVKLSRDPRQALCYQCHAPTAYMQVSSGDDRTPVGVHEGLSCFSCHQGHGQKTAGSCGTCHSQSAKSGHNVEALDTTFRSKQSVHNIHSVKCVDCHVNGVPKRKELTSNLVALR
jgi:Cytochrome c554 and c-prime